MVIHVVIYVALFLLRVMFENRVNQKMTEKSFMNDKIQLISDLASVSDYCHCIHQSCILHF